MRHVLTIHFDTPDNITTWDMRGIDARPFLGLCLLDLLNATIESFTCARIGPDTTEAIENCETVYSMGPRTWITMTNPRGK